MARSARLVWIFFCSCLALLAVPSFAQRESQHCVTAQVQTIRVAVYNKCGCKVGEIERAPKPGEKGFELCKCQAKKAVVAVSTLEKPTLYFAAAIEPDFGELSVSAPASSEPVRNLREAARLPHIPPPRA